MIGVIIASALGVVLIPVYGALSDRVGRRVVYSVGTVLFGLFLVPSYLLINTEQPILIWLSIVVALGLFYPAIYAPLAVFWAELFDTRIRYTGIGSVNQFSGIFASGLTPVIGASLVAYTGGSPWLFVGFMLVVTVMSLVAGYISPETYRKDITPIKEAQ